MRQPLESIILPRAIALPLRDILLDEINVKRVDIVEGTAVSLDLTLTNDLKMEGDLRDFVRVLQEMRKTLGLAHHEEVKLQIHGGSATLSPHLDSTLFDWKKQTRVLSYE